MQCCDRRAKKALAGSSRRALARRRRAAEISVADARAVFFAGINRSLKTPPGCLIPTVGSAWTYMLYWSVDPLAKKRSQRGANVRSELVRKRKAILGFGLVVPRRDLDDGSGRCGGGDAAAALWKSERSSSSSGRETGTERGGRMRGAKRKRRGREKRRTRAGTNGDDEKVNIGFGKKKSARK
ncbi:hypothetical protein U1Q18_032507 [Sarracenia purpurea var. burkii]